MIEAAVWVLLLLLSGPLDADALWAAGVMRSQRESRLIRPLMHQRLINDACLNRVPA